MMGMLRVLFLSFVVCLIGTGCLEQYDPSKHIAQFRDEEANANRKLPQLNEDGSLAGAGGGEQAVSIDSKYASLCASCHGETGEGNGPAGVALNPVPRNFSDSAWQNSVDDARITQVIKQGGGAVGLSALMAPFGSMLSETEVTAMVAKVRSFKK